jgi:hypothetical protein
MVRCHIWLNRMPILIMQEISLQSDDLSEPGQPNLPRGGPHRGRGTLRMSDLTWQDARARRPWINAKTPCRKVSRRDENREGGREGCWLRQPVRGHSRRAGGAPLLRHPRQQRLGNPARRRQGWPVRRDAGLLRASPPNRVQYTVSGY